MNRILCFTISLCLFTDTYAQETPSGLSTGDTVPNIHLNHIINHSGGKATLLDFQGKLLILDFWATWCAPCIALLPKTDSLQQVYKDQVQFLPVTYQSKEKVEKLLHNLQSRKGITLNLPIVVEDTVLHNLFPHRELPHYVWISTKGKVLAITGHEEVNAENIRRRLDHKPATLAAKQDKQVPFNREEPLLSGNTDISEKPVLYQSAFTGYIEGIHSSFTIFPKDSLSGRRVVALNAPLPTLYKIAYGSLRGTYFNHNRIITEVKDTTQFWSALTGNPYTAWLQDHSYCYELIVPPHLLGQEATIMQQDLARFFPQYTAKVEIRSRQVLAVVRTGKKDKLKSAGGTPAVEIDAFGCQLRNHYLSNLALQLNAKYLQHLSTPVIDETGYKGRVDMSLAADMSNVSSIKKALKLYDLDLVEKTQEIEVLVIRDAKNTSSYVSPVNRDKRDGSGTSGPFPSHK